MRKIILVLACVVPLVAGCHQKSGNVIDTLKPGTPVTVTTTSGQSISGQVTETRADALLVAPRPGAMPVVVPRAQIAAVTVAVPPPAANASQAAPPAGTEGPGAAPGTPTARAFREVTVPEGTILAISLDESIGSDSSHAEEPVHATLLEDVVADGVAVLPQGSRVSGAVTSARRAGKVKGVAELAVRFDSITPRGGEDSYSIRTGTVDRRAQTTHKKDAMEIGAPAAGGALIGGLLGGKKGALIGGAVGGGAGTAVVLSTRGQEVRLPRGAHLSIRLLAALTVRVPA